MYYKEFAPCNELKKYIKCYWIMEREYNEVFGTYENLWPTGLTELLFVKGRRFSYINKNSEELLANRIIIGAYNKKFTLKNHGQVKIIGIRAFNHGANLLFDFNANELKNTIRYFTLENLDDETLFKLGHKDLIEYLDKYCKLLIRNDDLLDVLYGLYTDNNISIQKLSEMAHLSKRQLERKVKYFTSFTPVELRTIIRFDKARLNMLFTRDYFQVMNDLGYHDYSHFSRDFKKFYEMTPKQFVEMFCKHNT